MKIFSHRAFLRKKMSDSNIVENSIAGLKIIRDLGFKGVELDFWFFDGDFYIKHDKPNFDELSKLPKIRNCLLFRNDIEYWLDFKNLQQSNLDDAIKKLKSEFEFCDILPSKIYLVPYINDAKSSIEVLAKMRQSLAKEIQIAALKDELRKEDQRQYYEFLKANNLKYCSINHEIIDEDFMKIFSDISIFAWTVNDINRAKFLKKLGVTAIATDDILPDSL